MEFEYFEKEKEHFYKVVNTLEALLKKSFWKETALLQAIEKKLIHTHQALEHEKQQLQ